MYRWLLNPLFLPVLLYAGGAYSPVEQRFTELRKNPTELYAFLLRMPKGADLHNHVSGAVYAESYLRAAAEDGLCVDLKTYSLVASPCGDNTVPAARTQTDNTLASQVIDSLSMRNFVPGRESAHDHFFATFAKFGPSRPVRRGEFIAEVIRRAAGQNESYLELMTINGASVNTLGTSVGFSGDFKAARNGLMESGLADAVKRISANIDDLEKSAQASLACQGAAGDAPACHIVFRHIYQVLREAPKEQVFAQILAGLMLASSDSRVAGINFVQPEDGVNSMRDYHLQMQMLDYAKRLYPNVHVSLHAGELASGLVPPDGLRFHIREAVELGHAERIGHGVDVMYETNAAQLLEKMRRQRVLVEINLTSNDLILGVRGQQHPFPVYRKYGVPVALSTDDEGVARAHLTEEYVRAARDYGLRYTELKDLARNSLEYSFLSGASYWQNHVYGLPTAVCRALVRGKACQSFLEANEKARLEADLENRFAIFERSVMAEPQ